MGGTTIAAGGIMIAKTTAQGRYPRTKDAAMVVKVTIARRTVSVQKTALVSYATRKGLTRAKWQCTENTENPAETPRQTGAPVRPPTR